MGLRRHPGGHPGLQRHIRNTRAGHRGFHPQKGGPRPDHPHPGVRCHRPVGGLAVPGRPAQPGWGPPRGDGGKAVRARGRVHLQRSPGPAPGDDFGGSRAGRAGRHRRHVAEPRRRTGRPVLEKDRTMGPDLRIGGAKFII